MQMTGIRFRVLLLLTAALALPLSANAVTVDVDGDLSDLIALATADTENGATASESEFTRVSSALARSSGTIAVERAAPHR